jgi:glycosyltransferase involved in cell wall biosynthesis
MRVLFVSNLYPPNVVGGYERLCFEVASAFAAAGHVVSVLTSNHGGLIADYPDQTILRSLRLLAGETIYEPFAGDEAARAAVDAANIEALATAITSERPDVIYSWNLFFLGASLLDALPGFGAPVYAMLTDNWLANMIVPEFVAGFFREHVFGDVPFPKRTGLLQRLSGRAPAPMPERPVAVTAVFGSEFMRVFYRAAGMRFARETVIHNGVEQALAARRVGRDRRKPAVSGEVRLLFAGRLVDLKGVDVAVAALGHLPDTLTGRWTVRLTIVGDAQDHAYVARLQGAIDANAGRAVIERQPTVAESELFDLFEAHDVYLFPSLYEPFSLTLIHALACGIPTIASDAGGNVEIVQDGVSGLVTRKGDAAALARGIEKLALDPILRSRLSEGGRRSASRFTFETMIASTERFFGA